MPFDTDSPHLILQACPARARAPVADHFTLARTLDREADAALFYGRANTAERLSKRAAELREGAP